MTEGAKELFAALAKARDEMTDPVKNAKNPHFRSDYADLNQVLACIREPLRNNGLLVIQQPDIHGDRRLLETHLVHVPTGERYDCGSIELVMDKQTAQAQGSAITYARRYALQTIFGLSAVDDDGNAASLPPKAKAKTQPKVASAKIEPFDFVEDALVAIDNAVDTEDALVIWGARVKASNFQGDDKERARAAYQAKQAELTGD